MSRVHDRGGWPGAGPIDRSEHQLADWERLADATALLLISEHIITTDELRRAIEDLEPGAYESLGYYERWVAAIEALLTEKNVLGREEIDQKVAQLEERVW